MTETTRMPSGITHEPDLTNLSYADRMAHHRKELRSIAFYQGLEGVNAYKLKHAEAGPIRTDIKALAYIPMPEGFLDAVGQLIGSWWTDDQALNRSLKEDVATLNAALGTQRFDPNRFSSKALTTSVRKRAGAVFRNKDAALPEAVNSLSDVKRAVKAAKANSQSDARPLGMVGTMSGNVLTIGSQAFPIQRQGNRECIRPTIGGKKRRLYLDELEWIAGLLTSRGTPEETSTYYPTVVVREPDQNANSGAPDPLEDISEKASPGEPDQSAPEPSSLSQRIKHLTAHLHTPVIEPDPNKDPLEF